MGIMEDAFMKKAKELNIKPKNYKTKDAKKPNQTKYSPKNKMKSRAAHAPYNFVPLNKIIVPGELQNFDIYQTSIDRHTGFIKLKITAQTPLFIRDTVTQDIYNERQKSKTNKPQQPNHFQAGSMFKIPGSTLRGMIRTLVEIVSWSKFQFFDDRYLYFRSFAAKTKVLRKAFVDKMMNISENSDRSGNTIKRIKYKLKAGYLCYKGGNYFIYPAKQDKYGLQFYRVEESKAIAAFGIPSVVDYSKGKKKPNRNYEKLSQFYRPAVFTIGKIGWRRSSRVGKTKSGKIFTETYCGIVDKIYQQNYKISGGRKGILITSGFGPSKHMHWIIAERSTDDKQVILIPEDIIKAYKQDKNRKEKYDLLKELEKGNKYVPCFYDPNTKAFGHTCMFRIVYENSIGNHVYDQLKDENKIDIAECLFGIVNEKRKLALSSRVYFEDAVCAHKNNSDEMTTSIPKVLGTPKPTSFQLYLTQDIKKQNLADYNLKPAIKAPIRGYKIYWHKNKNSNWEVLKLDKQIFSLLKKEGVDLPEGSYDKKEKTIYFQKIKNSTLKNKIIEIIKTNKREKHYTICKPISSGTTFDGCIRFENLTDVELGALLFVINLPSNCHHKIGMGKPLGLGSIEIEAKLYESERKNRYSSLKDEWLPWEKCDNKRIEKLKNSFAYHILTEIGESAALESTANVSKLWKIDRMKDLEKLLSMKEIGQGYWAINREYDELNSVEFNERWVLPFPEEV